MSEPRRIPRSSHVATDLRSPPGPRAAERPLKQNELDTEGTEHMMSLAELYQQKGDRKSSIVMMCQVYLTNGQADEAISLYKAFIESRREDMNLLQTRMQIGHALSNNGSKPTEDEPSDAVSAPEWLAEQKSIKGDIAQALVLLSWALRDSNRIEEALMSAQESVALWKDLDSVETSYSGNLIRALMLSAQLLRAMGNDADALGVLRDTIAAVRSVLDNPDRQLGAAVQETGTDDDDVQLPPSLADAKPPTTSTLVQLLASCGLCMLGTKAVDESLRVCDEAMSTFQALTEQELSTMESTERVDVAVAIGNIGLIYRKLNRFGESLVAYKSAHGLLLDVLGETHQITKRIDAVLIDVEDEYEKSRTKPAAEIVEPEPDPVEPEALQPAPTQTKRTRPKPLPSDPPEFESIIRPEPVRTKRTKPKPVQAEPIELEANKSKPTRYKPNRTKPVLSETTQSEPELSRPIETGLRRRRVTKKSSAQPEAPEAADPEVPVTILTRTLIEPSNRPRSPPLKHVQTLPEPAAITVARVQPAIQLVGNDHINVESLLSITDVNVFRTELLKVLNSNSELRMKEKALLTRLASVRSGRTEVEDQNTLLSMDILSEKKKLWKSARSGASGNDVDKLRTELFEFLQQSDAEIVDSKLQMMLLSNEVSAIHRSIALAKQDLLARKQYCDVMIELLTNTIGSIPSKGGITVPNSAIERSIASLREAARTTPDDPLDLSDGYVNGTVSMGMIRKKSS